MRSRMLTTMATRRWLAGAAAVAAVTLAGCSGGSGGTVAKTMNQHQAAAMAEQIVHDTATALHPQPRLDFDPSLGNDATQCLAEHLPDASKMVTVYRTAWLRGIPDGEQVNIANQVKAYWQKQGYIIGTTANFAQGKPEITGYTPHKDPFEVFTFTLTTASNGWISIGATSPCVWPNGTPPPKPQATARIQMIALRAMARRT